MTTNAPISLPSLDDIVFEGRNKAYGAYALRQLYGRHLFRAVTLAVALTALLIAVPIAASYLWPTVVVVPAITPKGPTVIIMPPPTIVQPPVTPPPASQATITLRTELSKNLPPTVVDDAQVQKPQQSDVAAPDIDGPVALGDINRAGTGGFADTANPGTPGNNDSAASSAAPAVTKPFLSVEVMPEFAGGQAALVKYLQRNLRYPTQALKAGVGGRVYIAFTVNTDGSIADVEVIKGLGYGTDEEASRVIRQMPTWKPGYQNHRAVPVRYNLPITFTYQ